MALCMAITYEPQAAQVNEEPPLKSSFDLTLTQHPHDEDHELQKMHTRLEVEPPRAWYYHIFPNFYTLVILLQVDLTSGDEPKTIYEGDTYIFAWFSMPSVGHYRWLCGSIHQLLHNSKADYLVCTIQHILDFL